MKYSPRVHWLTGNGADAWDLHFRAIDDAQTDDAVIVMSIGDPDFATSPEIVDTAIKALQAGDTHYTETTGRLPLRKAIAADLSNYGVRQINEDNIITLPGAQNALFTASLCLLSPGDEVVVLDPMYVTYEAYLGVSGAKLVRVPMTPTSGFRPDLEAIEASITLRTRALAFSNPANPSGVVFTRAELDEIAGIAKRHDLWVISDEVYSTLTFEQDHIMIAALPGMAERTVTAGSLSKSHAMTGWRIGWLCGPKEMIDHAENLALCMLYGLPGFIQEAAIQALTGSRYRADEMREIYRRRRDVVVSALSSIQLLEVLVPQSGMFVLVDIRKTGLSGGDFAWQLYEAEKVSVLDGAAFGWSAQGFIRLSFTEDEDTLRDACARIARFVSRLFI